MSGDVCLCCSPQASTGLAELHYLVPSFVPCLHLTSCGAPSTAGGHRWVQQEWDISHGKRWICSWWVTFISLQKWADGEAAQGVHFEGGVHLEMHSRKIRLARCLEDEGSREKLLCRPTACVGEMFAEKAAVGPIVLEFALISGEHFSRSHTEIALLWLPEISLPYEHSLWYLPCAGRKILPL